MSAERWGALPLGELHAEGKCYLCGREAPIIERDDFGGLAHAMDPETLAIDLDAGLKRTVDRVTMAAAHVCVDTIACERRRYNERRKV